MLSLAGKKILWWFLFVALESLLRTVTKVHGYTGFKCGDHIFDLKAVEKKARTGSSINEVGSEYPKLYEGSLYDKNLGYRYKPLFPVKNDKVRSPYFIVLDQNDKVVDVVAKMINDNFIKCRRQDGTSPTSMPDNHERSNGYQCSNEFFDDKIIRERVHYFMESFSAVSSIHSSCIDYQYKGKIHFICPIMTRSPVKKYGKSNIDRQSIPQNPTMSLDALLFTSSSPFYILLNEDKIFTDVIAILKNKSFVRCYRSRKEKNYITYFGSDVKDSKTIGYLCDGIIYNYGHLKKVIKYVRFKINTKAKAMNYPKRYYANHCTDYCLLWPLLPYGKLFTTGNPHKVYAVINSVYDFIYVVKISKENQVVDCPRIEDIPDFDYEKCGYRCGQEIFSYTLLEMTLNYACPKLRDPLSGPLTIYEGPNFEVPGKYFLWPLHRNKIINPSLPRHRTKLRIVFNFNCQLAGVITKDDNIWTKCTRLTDGSTPGSTDGVIRERKWVHIEKSRSSAPSIIVDRTTLDTI